MAATEAPPPSSDQIRAVSPALARHGEERLLGSLWNRPGLSRRDRALVTLAALIARGEPAMIGAYADRALQEGVKPQEISETVLHLAYYAGWGSAMTAVAPIADVFARRGIGEDQLPPVIPDPLPLDDAAEAARAQHVGDQYGAVAPALVQYTTDYLFRDLWLRPGLTPRDRSLVTVAALIARGQTAQLSSHLARAMTNGLTEPQAGEVITQVAFYAGWPCGFSAMPVAKEVFAKQAAR